MLRFEDRSLSADGRVTNRNKDDFLTTIYQIYESAISGNVPDEVMKLKRDWERADAKIREANDRT